MSDEPGPVSIRNGDRAAIVRAFETFLARNPNIFGGTDIYNSDVETPIVRAGIIAATLIGLVDENKRLAVSKFVVIAPPGSDRVHTLDTVWAQFVESIEVLDGRSLEPRELEFLKPRLEVLVSPDRRHRSVLDVIADLGERTAAIVMDAAGYRDDTVKPYIAPGAKAPLQAEDIWVPQLVALAAAVTELASERGLYVALDADKLSPRRKELSDLLLTVEGCGVIGSTNDTALETILAAHVDQWDAWIREGRLGRALSEIEALPPKFDRHKNFLRIQLLHRAGHQEHALHAIREEMRSGAKFDASSRVKLARVAVSASASALSAELLMPAIDQLASLEDLEGALATAVDGGLRDIEARVATRLESLFPGCASVTLRRLDRLVRSRSFAEAALLARTELGDERQASFYDTLSRHLLCPQPPDYSALINEAGSDKDLTDAYRMASVSDALSRKLLVHAFELVLPLPTTPSQSRRGERLLLNTLEALLLHSRKDKEWPVSADHFQMAILELIKRLAADPANKALRVDLASLMQPNTAGTTGLALMAALALELAARPVKLRKRGVQEHVGMDWLVERKTFLTAVANWMKAEEPIVIGRLALPLELLTESADKVVFAVLDYLATAQVADAEDIDAMLYWCAFGAAVAPHSSDSDYDLRLVRVVAGKLASTGNQQQARDLAEQALAICGGTARRRRLGWFAMADVYARGSNAIEALLAMSCALAADDCADEDEAYQEITGLARLLRDCGMYEVASEAVDKARDLLHRMGSHDTYGQQLDTLELQIRHVSMLAIGIDDDTLTSLLGSAIQNGRDVLSHGDSAAPVAAVLGQLIRLAKRRRLDIPPKAIEVFDELRRRIEGAQSNLIETISADRPTAAELLAMLTGLGPTRYSDDVGFDMRNVAIAASRALADDNLLKSAEETAFVLDLMADRGVALPGWDEAAAPPPAPVDVTESAKVASNISMNSVSVLQAGFDEDGRLVRLFTVAGELQHPFREPSDVILKDRMRSWAEAFPYSYGVNELDANLFYKTTANLRVSDLPVGPVVVAADTAFQAFPPNLLFVDGEFAGRTRPMAATPSLAWLGRAHSSGFIGDGRMCAWISTATDGGRTLPMIADRLQPTFEKYGFDVDNGAVLPRVFAGATLAVVAAHGGVHPEGRYFQVVSDEGVMRVSAADLANALRNIGAVVLFVCSGGRADEHPVANTTLGLAKQIIDRGCSAVVASPWPLDARVPSHWLPAFLENWTKGTTLMDANFQANKYVDEYFGRDPARGLAMTVFGNPLLVLPKMRATASEGAEQ